VMLPKWNPFRRRKVIISVELVNYEHVFPVSCFGEAEREYTLGFRLKRTFFVNEILMIQNAFRICAKKGILIAWLASMFA
jgi:hypothetical protein